MKTKGTIFKRTVSGNDYYYHQYLQDGKQTSKTITESEAYRLGFENYFEGKDVEAFLNHEFNLEVNYGENLHTLCSQYASFKKRFCYSDLQDFLTKGTYVGKIMILYGLRRTGKTTLMFQAINDYSIKDFAKVCYIKCNNGNTIYQLFDDLKYLTDNGFSYVFIDEVTLLEDFVNLSSTISDIYGIKAKIVLSGTDSLGFLIASHHELYDRYKMIHTTYISYKEFTYTLGNRTIDEYIEYGGTMSMEGIDYNKTIRYGNNRINEYVDSSIIHNIIHSLKSVDNGKYFFHLYDLYEKNELENVINRIIEDNNHRFTISVIEQDFKSHDYGSLKQILSSPKNFLEYGHILKKVDEEKLTKDLMEALNIINKEKQTHKIDESVLLELHEYLKELDVIKELDEIMYPGFDKRKRTIFTQPGLRYAQAKTLIEILLNEPSLKQYDISILSFVKEKLLSDVKGKMIEDMVIYETSIHNPNTFKMYFGFNGEYDMVTINQKDNQSDIYEIKYAKTRSENQYRFLKDERLQNIFENKYPKISKRTVLYRGENNVEENIAYLNVEQYLSSI